MKISILAAVCAALLFSQVFANSSCPRCKKIESARAAEGAQDAGYYDDKYPVHQNSGSTGPVVKKVEAPKPAQTPAKAPEAVNQVK